MSQTKLLYESITTALKTVYEEYDIEIDEKLNQAIVDLKGRQSERYTKLANRLERLRRIEKRTKEIKQEVKDLSKELIVDLFGAENAIYTRVVNTISAIFTLSKDPKPTETVQWKKVFEAFSEDLTPELTEKLEKLKKQYTSTAQKSPALRHKIKEFRDTGMETAMDEIIQDNSRFRAEIDAWAIDYDMRLNSVVNLMYNLLNQ